MHKVNITEPLTLSTSFLGKQIKYFKYQNLIIQYDMHNIYLT